MSSRRSIFWWARLAIAIYFQLVVMSGISNYLPPLMQQWLSVCTLNTTELVGLVCLLVLGVPMESTIVLIRYYKLENMHCVEVDGVCIRRCESYEDAQEYIEDVENDLQCQGYNVLVHSPLQED